MFTIMRVNTQLFKCIHLLFPALCALRFTCTLTQPDNVIMSLNAANQKIAMLFQLQCYCFFVSNLFTIGFFDNKEVLGEV